MTNYEFGEIVLIDFPQTDLQQRKKRPALVILDIGDYDLVLAPITTKKRTSPGDYKIKDWKTAGLLRHSWVRLAKIACLEKYIIIRSLGNLTEFDKKKIIKQWKATYTFSAKS